MTKNAQKGVAQNEAESNDLKEVAVHSVKKRGSKSASLEATSTATKDEIKSMVGNVLYWYRRDLVKTDEECAERLNEFFDRINETGEIPTVEKMCLALGTVRQTVWDWENGSKGAARADMIKKAKEILAGIDAELVSSGRIPQITYIFRAKNFFGLVDQSQVVLTPNNPIGEATGQKELAADYVIDVTDEQPADN